MEGADSKQNWWSRLPKWAKWTAGVVGAILLLGIGAAIGSSGEDEVKAERDEVTAELAKVTKQRDAARAEALRVHLRESKIIGSAKTRAAKIIGNARSESSTLSSKLETMRGSIDSAEGELASVEASLEGARETKAKSTIPGNGTYQAEVDFIPGTYEAPGGSGCYWATLNSADPFDIASNENASGPTMASVTTPYFQTQSCGTWTRIGD